MTLCHELWLRKGRYFGRPPISFFNIVQKGVRMNLGRGWLTCVLMASACVSHAWAGGQDKGQDKGKKEEKVVVSGTPETAPAAAPADSTTEGTVTVSGQVIAYRAVAGTITVGSSDAQDATVGPDGKLLPDTGEKAPDPAKPEEAPP